MPNTEHAKHTQHLEERPIRQLLWQFSAPAILATTVGASHQFINRAFVSWIFGEVGVTAVTLVMPVTILMMGFGMLIGVGSNTLIAIKLGEKKVDDAERIVGQALFLFLLVSVVSIILVLPFIDTILHFFKASERVLPYAKEYLSVSVCGIFLHQISFGINSFLRSEGKPRLAMMTSIIAALLNIVFDALFLFGFKTGIWGAAMATNLALAISSSWVVWHYVYGNTLLRWRMKYIRPNFTLARSVFLLGLPPFLVQFIGSCVHVLQNWQLKHYGDLYGAVHNIENYGDLAVGTVGLLFVIAMAIFMPLLGLNQGMQPIVGYNIGAGKHERVAKTLKLALVWQFAFTIFCSAFCLLFPALLIQAFISPVEERPDELMALGIHAIRIFVCMLPAAGFTVLVAGYFQSNGMAERAIMLTVVRQAGMLVPMLYFFPMLFEWFSGVDTGIEGIWWSIPCSDLGAGALAILLFFQERRRLKKAHKY